MIITTNDIMANGVLGPSFRIDAVKSLSVEEIAFYHLEQMRDYGWWLSGEKPQCFSCSEEISTPEEMRRYHGLTLHPKCFRTIYEREKGERVKHPESMYKAFWRNEMVYWNRVLELENVDIRSLHGYQFMLPFSGPTLLLSERDAWHRKEMERLKQLAAARETLQKPGHLQ